MNLLIIFGTRPEAIKMAPIILECKRKSIKYEVCITGQHKVVEEILKKFRIGFNYNLKIMKKQQTVNYIFYETIRKLEQTISKQYDYVLVHGDTTSAAAAAVWAFNNKMKVAHVEAGLRSNDLYDPFPEEMNRQIIDRISTLHFAPLKENKDNLLNENIKSSSIHVVGNTVIDSILNILKKTKKTSPKKQVLITCHRRENFDKMDIIFKAILNLAKVYKDYNFVFPMHPNKQIQEKALAILSGQENISMINHLEYFEFIKKLNESEFIITDSGGVLEESSFLCKKVLIVRNSLERRELLSPNIILSNVKNNEIIANFNKLTRVNIKREKKSLIGDGHSAEKILKIIKEDFKKW